jgi:hypothetical protein
LGRGELRSKSGWINQKERDHLEEPGVDERIILKLILKTRYGGMNWIDLAQYRDRWRAPANVVINLGTSYKACSKKKTKL